MGVSALVFTEMVTSVSGQNSTVVVPVRETLTANRTYFVRTDGSDSNTGLANTAGGAFLTRQKLIDVAASLDLATFSVTIEVSAGTYTGAMVAKRYVGAGPMTINGAGAATNSSVTSASCFQRSGCFVTL